MTSKKLFLALAASALLLLQFADCMSAMTLNQQSVQCCGSMPCTPANQSHDCCKAMVSAQGPTILQSARASLSVPVLIAIEHTPTLENVRSTSLPLVAVEAQQHSPPDLYTLHASLLI